jgi:hypothetical protein
MALHRRRGFGSLALWLMKTFGLYSNSGIRVSDILVPFIRGLQRYPRHSARLPQPLRATGA